MIIDRRKYKKGVETQIPNLKYNKEIKAIILNGIADLPAAALFTYRNQFNGRFGSSFCCEEDVLIRKNLRIYPFEEILYMRTNKETLLFAKEALESGSKVCGSKGPSIMSQFVHKYIISMGVDQMHTAFGGSFKQLLSL